MESILVVGLTNALVATLLALLLAPLASRMSASLAHGLWLLLLVKLLFPPILVLDLQWLPQPSSAVVTTMTDAAAIGASTALPASQLTNAVSWPGVAAAVWALGTLALLLVAAVRIVRFRRLLNAAADADPDLAGRVTRLAARVGLADPPGVVVTERQMSPVLWAFGTSCLVLPRRLLARLSGDELDTLLLHELAHLARRDHLARLVELAAVSAYWWLPTSWWIRRRLRSAEERCCDDHVTRALPDRRGAYARCLVATLRFLSLPVPDERPPEPILASRLGDATTDLKERLTVILTRDSHRSSNRLSTARRWLLLGCTLAVLTVFPTLARSGGGDPSASAGDAASFGGVLSQVAERSGLNFVVQPGLDLSASVDVDLAQTWEHALNVAVGQAHVAFTRVGNVVWIHRPGLDLRSDAEFVGQPIDLDLEDEDLSSWLDEMGEVTGLDFVLGDGIAGTVTVHLEQVPWDQALDVVFRLQGLRYAVEDGKVLVSRAANG